MAQCRFERQEILIAQCRVERQEILIAQCRFERQEIVTAKCRFERQEILIAQCRFERRVGSPRSSATLLQFYYFSIPLLSIFVENTKQASAPILRTAQSCFRIRTVRCSDVCISDGAGWVEGRGRIHHTLVMIMSENSKCSP